MRLQFPECIVDLGARRLEQMKPAVAIVFCLLAGSLASAQVPTGTIAGLVADASTAPLQAAVVTVTNRDSGESRTITTTSTGEYTAPVLSPGVYRIVASADGFKRLEREATVEAGTTTIVNLTLDVGEVTEIVQVAASVPRLAYDEHRIGSVVGRDQIENLPLNGRNFLDLARLEPGVLSPIRGTNNRQFVPVFGSAPQTAPLLGTTRTTVDGADVNQIGAKGAALQVSQEAVEQFQIATAAFDPSIGMTTTGAVNIVTRSGGNQFRADAFVFYRDHHLSAYPGLRRDPANPDPYFERRQAGGAVGGPLARDRVFFFATYERTDQDSVIAVQPGTPAFAPLGGIFPSPYTANQWTGRLDVAVSTGQHLFVRHSLDANDTLAPLATLTGSLPSGWSQTSNRAHLIVAGFASVLPSALVNDLRASAFFLDSAEQPADARVCPDCIGVGAPQLVIPDVGITLGQNRTLAFQARRLQISDRLSWSHRAHRFVAGLDWEHGNGTASSVMLDPAQLTLWAPARVQATDPTIPLPASFTTLDDFLKLPLQAFQTSVGPGVIPQRGFQPDRILNMYRLFGGDAWHVGTRLSIDAGVSVSNETGALNDDLTKPSWLAPLVGQAGLQTEDRRWRLVPRAGFAWTLGAAARSVIRGGAGDYVDALEGTNPVELSNERAALLPLGTTRLTASGSNLFLNGQPLAFQQPTRFTGADLMAILPALRTTLEQSLNVGNRDFSVRNIDQTKEASNLFDAAFVAPSAVHVTLGFQHEFAHDTIVSVDAVVKRFRHTTIAGIDRNLWNSARGPVLRPCMPSERSNLTTVCSNGPITFDESVGWARYRGLLVRLDKRLSAGWQLLIAYALGSYIGTNGTGPGTGFSNDDWNANVGPLPTDRRHELNVSSIVALPHRFQLAVNLSASSAPPFSAYVNGLDFNGDGTANDLLPGTSVNQFGQGSDRGDLAALVTRYNQQVAGTRVNGVLAPILTLPASYAFNDTFCSLDLRLQHTVPMRPVRVILFAELFNVFNAANLLNYAQNLTNPATFGQPSARFDQVFGSGGPRAAQFGIRISR